MEIIQPIDILLFNSNIDESTYPEWDKDGSYNEGDRVKVSFSEDGITEITPHKVYELLPGGNGTKYPPDHPEDWVYVSSTNRWKMFDDYVNKQTENINTIEVEVDASRCNRVCFANVDARRIEVTVTDPATGETYSTSIDMFESGAATSWSSYFFGGITWKDYAILSIPYYFGAKVFAKIISKSSGGTVKCGIMRCGRSFFVGLTEQGATSGILDYSKRVTNDYGEVYLRQGNWAKRLQIDVFVPTGSYSAVNRFLANIRALKVFFNANNVDECQMDASALEVYGFVRDFNVIYQNKKVSKCRMTIEGMI